MNKKKYKLLVVDDHPIVAEGIVALASRQENVVCKSADCLEELKQAASNERFDLCIIDLELPGSNGFKAVEYLHSQMPECRILIYTMHEEPWTVAQLSDVDIDGAVSKNDSIGELDTAIRQIRAGERYFSRAFAELKQDDPKHDIHKVPVLSKREKEVLTYLSQGLSTAQIAQMLFLSVNTVQTYRKRLLEKLEAKNVAELVCKGKTLF